MVVNRKITVVCTDTAIDFISYFQKAVFFCPFFAISQCKNFPFQSVCTFGSSTICISSHIQTTHLVGCALCMNASSMHACTKQLLMLLYGRTLIFSYSQTCRKWIQYSNYPILFGWFSARAIFNPFYYTGTTQKFGDSAE